MRSMLTPGALHARGPGPLRPALSRPPVAPSRLSGGRLAVKRHQNTLYVTTQGSYLAKDGEAVAVRVQEETRLRIPIHTLGGIVCFGQVSASPFLLGFCGERGVTVSLLTE